MSPSIDYILQYLSIALLYFVGFLGGTHVLGILTLYQIFFYTPLWPVVLLYLSWTYLVEWKTPERGGRDLLINFVRRLSVFKYMRDYYPITLVKTSDLDPQKNYIFGYHPHGAFTEGASIGLNTEACGFSDKFPGIIPHLSVTSGTLNQLESPYYRSGLVDFLRLKILRKQSKVYSNFTITVVFRLGINLSFFLLSEICAQLICWKNIQPFKSWSFVTKHFGVKSVFLDLWTIGSRIVPRFLHNPLTQILKHLFKSIFRQLFSEYKNYGLKFSAHPFFISRLCLKWNSWQTLGGQTTPL